MVPNRLPWVQTVSAQPAMSRSIRRAGIGGQVEVGILGCRRHFAGRATDHEGVTNGALRPGRGCGRRPW